jgi:hypothetical protein
MLWPKAALAYLDMGAGLTDRRDARHIRVFGTTAASPRCGGGPTGTSPAKE